LDCSSKRGHGCDVDLVSIVWLILLESRGELVSVGKDLINGSGHGDHLRNFSRARITWTMTTAVSPWMEPTSRMVVAAFAPIIMVKPSPRSQIRIGFR
jgi:hypothetical protein